MPGKLVLFSWQNIQLFDDFVHGRIIWIALDAFNQIALSLDVETPKSQAHQKFYVTMWEFVNAVRLSLLMLAV